jgi:uncharacterized membrane protein YcaP (DUF421 family)
LPWWEFVVRGAIVYVFLLVILRITGKRQTEQLAPFDLVLLFGSQQRGSEFDERRG